MPPVFPDPESLDLADGLRRVGNNRRLYHSLLTKFRGQQMSAPATIRTALLEGRRADAERLAHTVKGVAGNLGARATAAAAAAVEKAAQASDAAGAEAALPALESALTQLGEALDLSLPALMPPEASPGPAPMDPSRLRAVILQLEALLREDSADATARIEEAATLAAGTRWEAGLREISRQVGAYDFDAALAALKSLPPMDT